MSSTWSGGKSFFFFLNLEVDFYVSSITDKNTIHSKLFVKVVLSVESMEWRSIFFFFFFF